MNQYIVKDYAKKLTKEESQNTTKTTNFISHHCVVNPKKPEKIKAVSDAGVKFETISLNDLF